LQATEGKRINLEGAAGAWELLKRLVAQIRAQWPEVRILAWSASGFCREFLPTWCEAEGHRFLFSLAGNSRLAEELAEV
jgi:hypothetical protein